jgi:hypothetical protein
VYIVAIHYVPGAGEALVDRLAEALGRTVYEARARLSSPEGGPTVVGNFAEIEPAWALAGRLRANEIPPILLMPEEVESDAHRFFVRSFALGENGLTAVSRQGQTAEQAFAKVELILRGVRIRERRQSEEPQFSPVRAAVTAGMVTTKITRKAAVITTEEREDFLHLYADGSPALVFRADALNYQSLGPALHPSAAANFEILVDDLRQSLPRARYDERLMNRQARARVLGPSLTENHLDVAVSLLARVLRRRSPDLAGADRR